MTPRRILLVELNEDGTTGGSHQALLDLVNGLDRRRWQPVVLCYQSNAFVGRFRVAGAEVHVWDAERSKERSVRGPWWMPWRAVTQPIAIARRVRFIRDMRIDLVHVNNSPSFSFGDWLIASRLAGIPCISHVRGALARMTPPARYLIPRFDRLIAISASIEAHVQTVIGARAAITRVYDGIDAEAVQAKVARSREDVRAELGVPDGDVFVLMVGHLRRWKGQHVLLQAARLLEPAILARLRIVFVGAPDPFAPDYETELREAAASGSFSSRVSFLGARSDVPDLMHAADVVVHASTVEEPFGLVVVEALVLGRPVIASRLGGPGEIVVEGAGWTFDPADPSQLANHLRFVCENPAAIAAASAPARARAASFRIADTVAGVERVYDQVLGRRSPEGRDPDISHVERVMHSTGEIYPA